MNIFYIDPDPITCAEYHVDSHVRKMVIEYAQMLSTAHRVLDGEKYEDYSSGRKITRWRHPDIVLDSVLYKSTHVNHPCNIWVRQSAGNYQYLYELFVAVADEFIFRREKVNLTDTKLRYVLDRLPVNIPEGEMTTPALAMPEEYHQEDAVAAYRNFYINDKAHLKEYTDRPVPFWWDDKGEQEWWEDDCEHADHGVPYVNGPLPSWSW